MRKVRYKVLFVCSFELLNIEPTENGNEVSSMLFADPPILPKTNSNNRKQKVLRCVCLSFIDVAGNATEKNQGLSIVTIFLFEVDGDRIQCPCVISK